MGGKKESRGEGKENCFLNKSFDCLPTISLLKQEPKSLIPLVTFQPMTNKDGRVLEFYSAALCDAVVLTKRWMFSLVYVLHVFTLTSVSWGDSRVVTHPSFD